MTVGWSSPHEQHPAPAAALLPEMPSGYGFWDAAEVIEMAQACPVRTVPTVGHIQKRGGSSVRP